MGWSRRQAAMLVVRVAHRRNATKPQSVAGCNTPATLSGPKPDPHRTRSGVVRGASRRGGAKPRGRNMSRAALAGTRGRCRDRVTGPGGSGRAKAGRQRDPGDSWSQVKCVGSVPQGSGSSGTSPETYRAMQASKTRRYGIVGNRGSRTRRRVLVGRLGDEPTARGAAVTARSTAPSITLGSLGTTISSDRHPRTSKVGDPASQAPASAGVDPCES